MYSYSHIYVFVKSERTVTTSGGTVTRDLTLTSCTADRIVIFFTFVCACKRKVEIYLCCGCCCLGADHFAIHKAKALYRMFQSKYQIFHPT